LDLKVKLLSIIYLQLSWMVFILYKKVQLAQKLILGPLELPCNLII
jgi:hypothetical protein